jgi:hypothetical protein
MPQDTKQEEGSGMTFVHHTHLTEAGGQDGSRSPETEGDTRKPDFQNCRVKAPLNHSLLTSSQAVKEVAFMNRMPL